MTPITFFYSTETSLDLPALIDSGVDENFIDWNLAKQLKLPVQALYKPHQALALEEHLLSYLIDGIAPDAHGRES